MVHLRRPHGARTRLAAALAAALVVAGGPGAAAAPATAAMRSIAPHAGGRAAGPAASAGALAQGSQEVTAQQATAWLLQHKDPRHPQPSDEYLRLNTEFALRAREEVPAAKLVPQELFLGEVLPYLQLDEPLDEWRSSFFEVLANHAKGASTLREAAEAVVPRVWDELRASPQVMSTVHQHANKTAVVFKSNCTPSIMAPISETLAAGHASCTGCSILVADALRSVGIPARVVGTPEWNLPTGGNHNWVEVWTGEGDHGGWHFFDAAPADKVDWDRAWFVPVNTKVAEAGGIHGIYAPVWDASTADTRYSFTWREPASQWPAVDRTAFYKALS